MIRTDTMAVGWPDILIRTGQYKWMPPLPVTLGNELTGTIEAIGSEVSNLSRGQRVYLGSRELGFQSGCYTDLKVAPARAVLPLPDEVDLEQAAGLGYFSLAWALLHDAARGGETSALIIGAAGGAGSCLVQIAKQAGMTVIGAVSSDEKAQFARSLGADHCIDYRSEDVARRVLDITNGRGVDLILDPVVGPHFDRSFGMLARWGTVVVYNATGGPPGEGLFASWRATAAKCHGLRYFSMHVYEDDAAGRRRIIRAPLELMAAGKIRTPVARRIALSEVARAHALIESGKALGKILLKP
ncbi:quinone oxidoreductase family protein [Bradyrhizobium sp.]|uniref:quinone oxidoreductase family protein n=1 Tax=Bradyrhizobium sp. TaxID=376 RepID=UPI0039E54494